VNIGGSIAVTVIGAIFAFAIEDRIPGIDMFTLGIIIMMGGGVWLVLSLLFRAKRDQTEVLTTTEITEQKSTEEGDIVIRRTDREVFTDDDA
jgi:hypothetical protein